jgi:ATP-dependent Clp protease ATP-binding subunit ClpX
MIKEQNFPPCLLLNKKQLEDNNIIYYSDKIFEIDSREDNDKIDNDIDIEDIEIFNMNTLPFADKFLYPTESEYLLKIFKAKHMNDIKKQLEDKEGFYFIVYYSKENEYIYNFIADKKTVEDSKSIKEIYNKMQNSSSNRFAYFKTAENAFLENEKVDIELEDKEPKEIANQLVNIDEINIEEVYENIQKSIIGQDAAIKKILGAIYTNQLLLSKSKNSDNIRLQKKVVLAVGPTGTGKTEIIKQIAKEFDLPILIEDATRFTKEGYVGGSIQDIFNHLIDNCDGNFDKAESSILVIDEIDKLAKSNGQSGVGSDGVQNALLKLIDGNKFTIEDDSFSYDFDTSHLTIILLGAFSNLKKGTKDSKHVGFIPEENKPTNQEYTTEDFIKYGMIPEFMGRISNIVTLKELKKEDLKKILCNSEISPLNLKEDFLKTIDIDLTYDDNFIKEIVAKAINLNTGARGLKTAIYNVFDEIDFELLKGDISEVNFDGETSNLVRTKKIVFSNKQNIQTNKKLL